MPYDAPSSSTLWLKDEPVLAPRGPDPGFSGVEYPLGPREIFLEFEHVY